MDNVSNSRILYLEDSREEMSHFMSHAKENGVNNIICATSLDDLRYLDNGSVKILIADATLHNYQFPNELGIFQRIREKNNDIRIILLTRESVDSKLIKTLRDSDISIYKKSELYAGMAAVLFNEINQKNAQQIFTYKNELIDELSSKDLVTIADSPQILTDIRQINKSYYEMVRKNPESMYELTARQFDEFTAEMFEKKRILRNDYPGNQGRGKRLIYFTQY